MNTKTRLLSAGLTAMTLICASIAMAADTTWVPGGGPNDWNVDANWLNVDGQNFTPDAGFEDAPVIANGGTAFLDSEAVDNDDPFPSVTVSNGGLEIRNGGALKANALTIAESSSLSLAGDGTLTISGDATTTGSTVGTIAIRDQRMERTWTATRRNTITNAVRKLRSWVACTSVTQS